jgi:hypothetical protein
MIYLGNFFFLSNQQDRKEEVRRHGSFNLLVEAVNHEIAIEMFREQLVKLKSEKDFFTGKSTIYFTHLLEFDTMPKKEAFLINFKSTAGDPIMPFIGCTVPTAESDGCKIFDWQDEAPEIDGKTENLFLAFDE